MNINPNLTENARHDAALVTAARSGDERAFAQLLKRHIDGIYYMILKIVKNKLDTEELTLEAFEKAFTNIDKYSPQFAFSTWLSTIAFNSAINYLRRKKRNDNFSEAQDGKNKGSGSDYADSVCSCNDNPEDTFIKEENAEILHKMVSTMKPRYRTLLEMRYFNEFSYSEIAARLNLPLGTVKVQLFRSREMLFELLKNSEISC
jgi:RNA polymerase sigma factor (sigma-70 family)